MCCLCVCVLCECVCCVCALCVCFVPSIGAVVAGAIRSGLNMSHANAKCRGKPSRSDKATASGRAKGGVSVGEGGCIEQGFSYLACCICLTLVIFQALRKGHPLRLLIRRVGARHASAYKGTRTCSCRMMSSGLNHSLAMPVLFKRPRRP